MEKSTVAKSSPQGWLIIDTSEFTSVITEETKTTFSRYESPQSTILVVMSCLNELTETQGNFTVI